MDGKKRRSIWLGKVQARVAETWRSRVEELVNAKNEGREPFNDTSVWVGKLADKFHQKLSAVGLAPKRNGINEGNKAHTLKSFLDHYINKRTDAKVATRAFYGHTRRCLIDYFGADKVLGEITYADAKDWRRWMGRSKADGGEGLAENTVRRRCGLARQFFNEMRDARLISENPFAPMKKIAVQKNKSRDYFITPTESGKVLAACPTNEWKLIWCLARYAALRIPSELENLTWGDVNFDANNGTGSIVIHAPKTEHHGAEHSSRVIPIYGEVRPYLQQQLDDLLEAFDPKAESLSKQHILRRYRGRNNIRTQLSKIIRRAGLIPWPKLYQNCRVTRKNELRDLGFDPETICAWLGHDARTAFTFYHEPTASEFEKAANLQIPMQSAAVSRLQGMVPQRALEVFTEDYGALPTCTNNQWATLDSNQ